MSCVLYVHFNLCEYYKDIHSRAFVAVFYSIYMCIYLMWFLPSCTSLELICSLIRRKYIAHAISILNTIMKCITLLFGVSYSRVAHITTYMYYRYYIHISYRYMSIYNKTTLTIVHTKHTVWRTDFHHKMYVSNIVGTWQFLTVLHTYEHIAMNSDEAFISYRYSYIYASIRRVCNSICDWINYIDICICCVFIIQL